MSYSSNFTVHGDKFDLCAEWIGEAYTLELALCQKDGKRSQAMRIPLNDFQFDDLCMFSSYVQALITNLDAEEMFMMQQGFCDEDEEEGAI